MERNGVPYYFTITPDGTPMGIVEDDVPCYFVTNLQDGMIHRMVLFVLDKTHEKRSSAKTWIYYNRKDWKVGIGFCDLYNTETGEVWELKKNSKSWSCRTKTAQKQLSGYISGRLAHNPTLELKLPYTTKIPLGNFQFKTLEYYYDITYWDEGNGILRYSYTKSKTELRKAADAIEIVVAAGVIFLVAPETIPFVAPAFQGAFG